MANHNHKTSAIVSSVNIDRRIATMMHTLTDAENAVRKGKREEALRALDMVKQCHAMLSDDVNKIRAVVEALKAGKEIALEELYDIAEERDELRNKLSAAMAAISAYEKALEELAQ